MSASVKAGCAALGFLIALTAVETQAGASCDETPDPRDAGVWVLRCGGAVLATEAETVRSPVAAMSSHPNVIQLESGALAVMAPPSAAPFAALTREVVISGLESEWAVVSEAGHTGVVVWRGMVTMRLRIDGSETTFQAGDPAPEWMDPERLERLRRALKAANDNR